LQELCVNVIEELLFLIRHKMKKLQHSSLLCNIKL
jgi:hypothetical protein